MGRGSRGTRYGAAHERLRRRLLAEFVPGQPCAIGGEPLRHKGRLHLAHNEAGTGYLGLACEWHNLADAGAKTDWHGNSKPRDPDPRPWQGF